MDITCNKCKSEFELEGTPTETVLSCPVCEEEINLQAKKKASKKRPKMQARKQKSSLGKREKTVKPPKTGMIINWLWLYTIIFIIAAFVCGYFFSNIVHEKTGQKSGLIVGLPVGLFVALFGLAFAIVAKGLKNKKKWAYNMGCNFLYLNIFSPFFILAFIGLKNMGHEDTLSAFDIDQD